MSGFQGYTARVRVSTIKTPKPHQVAMVTIPKALKEYLDLKHGDFIEVGIRKLEQIRDDVK